MLLDNRASGTGIAFQIEEPKSRCVFVVHVSFRAAHEDISDADALAEIEALCRAIDLDIVTSRTVTIDQPKPGTFLGTGKVAEFSKLETMAQAELVVVNAQLSPVQQRNLERAWDTKVIDRTGLILEIFGRRARTREGRLQVELAHLQYQKSRLVRSWTHLERQRGGLGFIGGPGETQIEADRRLIQQRITRLKKQLEKVKTTRALHRLARKRVPYPVVALIGYTNAGKSSLFNALSTAQVVAEDQLFATLDPTMREVPLPHGRKIILADTVGFISQLPTTLIAAFRATLEEVLEADFVLHVRDISHPQSQQQAEDVKLVLDELGVGDEADLQILEVWNKIDLLAPETAMELREKAARRRDCVVISALTGEGLDALLSTIEARLAEDDFEEWYDFKAGEGARLSRFYRLGEVLERIDGEDGSVRLKVRLTRENAGRVV